jgi:hypothetical protein
MMTEAANRLCIQVIKNRTDKNADKFFKHGKSVEMQIQCADVDMRQLDMGIVVEQEHTNDLVVAAKVALDHIAEFEDYYTGLAQMEKELKKYGKQRK